MWIGLTDGSMYPDRRSAFCNSVITARSFTIFVLVSFKLQFESSGGETKEGAGVETPTYWVN